jgi:tetratricopeptide (TPR) repeat protein
MRAALIATMLLAALALPAGAQPAPGAPPAEDAKEKARVHFQKAKELHEKKQYGEAAAEYLEAYRYMPAPAFIYNAGQVYRLGGEKEKAVEHYKKYLELEPKGEGADDARQFIAELTAEIEADRKAAAPGTGEPGAAPVLGGGSGGGDPGGGGAPPVRDAQERPGRGLMLAGMVSGGVGVAAMGAAVVFALRARSAESDLDGYQGVWTPDRQDRYATGQSAERNMTVSVVIGVAALGAGGTMYFLGRRKARRAEAARPSIGAAAGGDAALLWVTGSF